MRRRDSGDALRDLMESVSRRRISGLAHIARLRARRLSRSPDLAHRRWLLATMSALRLRCPAETAAPRSPFVFQPTLVAQLREQVCLAGFFRGGSNARPQHLHLV